MKPISKTYPLILSALFLALAYLLPFLTGQIPEIGSALCPMHIPVLLCGFLCGWQAGLTVGLIAPLFRSLTLGMPVLFPMAVCMSLELAAYGATAGFAHRLLPRKKPFIYCSLLIAMVVGRLAWGGAMYLCLGLSGSTFSPRAFLAGAVTGAVPGILLQILFVPVLVMILDNPRVLPWKETPKS